MKKIVIKTICGIAALAVLILFFGNKQTLASKSKVLISQFIELIAPAEQNLAKTFEEKITDADKGLGFPTTPPVNPLNRVIAYFMAKLIIL